MKRFLITIHAIYVLVGIANTMLGPLLPLLAARWQLSDRQSGMFFLVQFVGGFAGAICSTNLAKRFPLHSIASAGLFLTAIGFAGLAAPAQLVAYVSIFANGFGLGLVSPTLTAAVSEAVPQHRAAVLNLLNFVWALGAITAPNLVLIALRQSGFSVPGMLRGFGLVLAITALLVPRVITTRPAEEAVAAELPSSTWRLIVACGVLIFVYVGIENGVAGWLPTFATRVHRFTVERSALLQDTFWTTFLIGRFCAPAVLRVVAERMLLTLSVCLAAIGTALLLTTNSPQILFVAVMAIGVGCAPVFPTAIALLSHRLSGQSGTKLGYMFASAGLGAAFFPYCIGALSSATNSLRIGMCLLLFYECALLMAHFTMSYFAARTTSSAIQIRTQGA
ncbi:major facilitator superfamily (MFS) transporter [Candidatus Koribacter versatilis Ellin345]|uniref:Major facilitator superfamily (MFS) transporter n=1 Tax=Koribacter versatilis (strain Ellin345) TaxID=204669 RepID=Q1IUB1_KORVE|nr:MFS transporter [Candidatus Koribacter versatilis]ABF39539.1 major facilitator superfamily (MFS) transporter [Candidatus Koribacter versatilis Ellin345]